jgi:hypothetical protein
MANIRRITSPRFYENIISRELIDNFLGKIEEGQRYEVLLDDFSAIVSDPPMRAMDKTLQPMINEARTIFDSVCDVLASKSYHQLRTLSREERGLSLQEIRKEETYPGELSLLLQGIQHHFSQEEWNRIWASKTRLEI